MKYFYITYCIVVVLGGTYVNYWAADASRGWSSGSSSRSGSSGWHK